MGKRIISQARGKGSLTYRVRRRAFMFGVGYPVTEGEATIIKLFSSAAHSAPLIKCKVKERIFYNLAFDKAVEGHKFEIGKGIDVGNVVTLKDIPPGTRVFNIEKNPGDGGKMMRSAGSSAVVNKIYEHNKIGILMPSKKEVKLSGNCRATIGVIAGHGKKLKPFFKAGKKFYKMRAKGKLYPRVSAVCVNAIDHPFGSGRGKRIKSKIVKRNAPPGRRVGHISPSKTGKKR